MYALACHVSGWTYQVELGGFVNRVTSIHVRAEMGGKFKKSDSCNENYGNCEEIVVGHLTAQCPATIFRKRYCKLRLTS